MKFVLKNKVFLGIILSLTLVLFFVDPVNAEIESPKKQIENGVLAEEVICKTGLNLVIRNNGYPACVNAGTAEKLEERGLGKIEITKSKAETPTKSDDVAIRDLVESKDVEENKIPTKTQVPTNSKDIQVIPASSGSIVNFYITDDDLNLAHTGIETVSTEGLLEFSINGIPIEGPQSMIETGADTGKFYVKLQLPSTINGRPLDQNDIVLIKYLDGSDYSGDVQTITKSIPLTNSYAQVTKSGGGSRIGHEFTVRIYEPDANMDSQDNDRIPLSQLEYRGEGGIRTTLANPGFDANSSYLIETGENTNVFEVKIKIPRKLDGKTVGIGDWYEIRYIDRSTPSGSSEKIVLQGKIG